MPKRGHPRSFRSWSVKSGKTRKSMSFSTKRCAYCPARASEANPQFPASLLHAPATRSRKFLQ